MHLIKHFIITIFVSILLSINVMAAELEITFENDSLLVGLLKIEDFSDQQIQILINTYGEDALLLTILDAAEAKITKLKIRANKILEVE